MVVVANRPSGGQGPDARKHDVRSAEIEDIRTLIPALGLREYWYPALEAGKVGKKPVGLMICGEQLVFFQGANAEVKALSNVCPHRGGSLMHGDCHYPGTISCPYHGWTYDGDGNVLAVLPEGPDSQVPGKVKARKFPTRTLKGMVFVWMGEGEPAPIEEDVPPELFDDHTYILFSTEMWPANWNVALENGVDAHVPYVHRNAVRTLMFPMNPISGFRGSRNKIVNGRAVVPDRYAARGGRRGNNYKRTYYPNLGGYWPKHTWRSLWNWIVAPAALRHARKPQWAVEEEWRGGHHLPAMYRGDHKTDMYTRNAVPVTETTSRQIYFKAVRPKNRLGWWYEKVHFHLYGRWMQVRNFSIQDFSVIAPQRYDTREYLSSTDVHQVLWRRLILQARGMTSGETGEIPETPAEAFSMARQREAAKVGAGQ